jgi:lysozyme
MGWGIAERPAPVVLKLAAALAVSAAGLTFIATHEGTKNVVYLDPVNIATVCTGHTGSVTRSDVGRRFSDSVCRDLLGQDVRVATAGVVRSVRVPISQNQFDALVSFTFNVGTGALHTSSLVKLLNAGDCKGAAAQFDRWKFAKGRVLNGLVTRRAEERALFEKDCPNGQATQAARA